ncbi:small integral membrane protein 8 [Stigmatopora argus]
MVSKKTHQGKDVVLKPVHMTSGSREARSTTLFRVINPELFIKPNKPVMAFGLISITLCIGYLGYLHVTKENDQHLYEAIDGKRESLMRGKASKWG